MHALVLEFGSAAQLSKRPGSVWNCLWGNALKRSPGIIRKSRVSYPGPGFLSSATWPSLPKKHYNGLNQTKPKPTKQRYLLRFFDVTWTIPWITARKFIGKYLHRKWIKDLHHLKLNIVPLYITI